MKRTLLFTLFLLAILNQSFINAMFYLPGVAPAEYSEAEEVALSVNQLTSVHTQMPMRYYDLPFCAPDSIVDDRENLGELLTGDFIENSPYIVGSSLLFFIKNLNSRHNFFC